LGAAQTRSSRSVWGSVVARGCWNRRRDTEAWGTVMLDLEGPINHVDQSGNGRVDFGQVRQLFIFYMREIRDYDVAGDVRLLLAGGHLDRHGDRSVSGDRVMGSELQRLHSQSRAMRGHALVLLVVVALVMPATRAVGGGSSAAASVGSTPTLGGESIDAVFDPGDQLVRRGDYTQAEQFFADVASGNQTAAPRALLLEARATLADGDPAAAETILQQLLADYPGSDQNARAYFGLEQVRRAAGDCSGAMRALDAFEATAGATAIGPYTALQRARKIAGNLVLKIRKRSMCCGNYGDPGC